MRRPFREVTETNRDLETINRTQTSTEPAEVDQEKLEEALAYLRKLVGFE